MSRESLPRCDVPFILTTFSFFPVTQTTMESLLVARFKDSLLGSLDDLSLHIHLLEDEARTLAVTRDRIDTWLGALMTAAQDNPLNVEVAGATATATATTMTRVADTAADVRVRLAQSFAAGGFVRAITGCDIICLQAVVRVDRCSSSGASSSGAGAAASHEPSSAAVLELGADGHWHRMHVLTFSPGHKSNDGRNSESTAELLKDLDDVRGTSRQTVFMEASHTDQHTWRVKAAADALSHPSPAPYKIWTELHLVYCYGGDSASRLHGTAQAAQQQEQQQSAPSREALAHIMRTLPGWLGRHQTVALEGCFPAPEVVLRVARDDAEQDGDADRTAGGHGGRAGAVHARSSRLMTSVTHTLTRGYPAICALFPSSPTHANHFLAGLDAGNSLTEVALLLSQAKELLRVLNPSVGPAAAAGEGGGSGASELQAEASDTDQWVARDDRDPDVGLGGGGGGGGSKLREGCDAHGRPTGWLPGHRLLLLHEAQPHGHPTLDLIRGRDIDGALSHALGHRYEGSLRHKQAYPAKGTVGWAVHGALYVMLSVPYLHFSAVFNPPSQSEGAGARLSTPSTPLGHHVSRHSIGGFKNGTLLTLRLFVRVVDPTVHLHHHRHVDGGDRQDSVFVTETGVEGSGSGSTHGDDSNTAAVRTTVAPATGSCSHWLSTPLLADLYARGLALSSVLGLEVSLARAVFAQTLTLSLTPDPRRLAMRRAGSSPSPTLMQVLGDVLARAGGRLTILSDHCLDHSEAETGTGAGTGTGGGDGSSGASTPHSRVRRPLLPDCHVYQLTDLASALAATEVSRREYTHWVAAVAGDSDAGVGDGSSAGAGDNADDASDASSTSSGDVPYLTATGQSALFNAPDCGVVVGTDEWVLDAVLASRCANREHEHRHRLIAPFSDPRPPHPSPPFISQRVRPRRTPSGYRHVRLPGSCDSVHARRGGRSDSH